ncbi:hypothetical protein BLX90_24760 (plasmid) [Rhizobium sp. Y9]|nr:hypothetical protein BLX90_24760 [Rhizobium sp. Y9]
MIILDGQIEKISYPRIHPLRNAAEGVEWLKMSGSEANPPRSRLRLIKALIGPQHSFVVDR